MGSEARCSCAHGDVAVSDGSGGGTEPGADISSLLQFLLFLSAFLFMFLSIFFEHLPRARSREPRNEKDPALPSVRAWPQAGTDTAPGVSLSLS